PDVTVSLSHTGDFTAGQSGATLTAAVKNSGGTPTHGAVTFTSTLPPGLTPVSASGAGWACGVSGQTVTCTRPDALAPAGTYPAITITTTVASHATTPLAVTATVAGGGETDTSNDSATDNTSVLTGARLGLVKTTSGDFVPDSSGTYLLQVSNTGSGITSG